MANDCHAMTSLTSVGDAALCSVESNLRFLRVDIYGITLSLGIGVH